MIRRSHKHHALGIVGRQMQSCCQNRRRRITRRWFNQYCPGDHVRTRQLFGHNKTERIRRDNNWGCIIGAAQSIDGGLKQAFVTDQGRKLFGIAFAGQRPKPGTRAPTKKNWSYHNMHCLPFSSYCGVYYGQGKISTISRARPHLMLVVPGTTHRSVPDHYAV